MLPLLYSAFVLSGAAGLIYESIWARYLGLFVGHSAYAQVIVLVIFLGGMSLGALFVGVRSERLTHPLLWYAAVELATGLIGGVFHDVFVGTTSFAYSTLFPAMGVGATQLAAKWIVAALLILPQSILLGATFPLMSAGVVRRVPERAGHALSLLYFANSIGAAAGVLFAGFYLVAQVGLPGTLLVAATFNVVVAAGVFLAARSQGEVGTPAETPPAADVAVDAGSLGRGRLWQLLLAVSFGTALSSFIYEIGWTRMLALVLGSATHAFELMLSAFILGLALGALWVRRRADAAGGSLRLLAIAQLAMGTFAIATLPVYLESFHWMIQILAAFAKTPAGYAAFNVSRYAICLAVMLPATFCAGMTLPLITRTLIGAGVGERAIGQVYGVNTFGSIVGAGLAGLVLLPVLGLKWLLIAGAAVDIGLGVVLVLIGIRDSGLGIRDWRFGFGRGHESRIPSPASRVPLIAATLATVLILGIVAFADFDPLVLTSGVYRYGFLQDPKETKLSYHADGRTATVSVRRLSNGSTTLITNGKPDASLGAEFLSGHDVPLGPMTHDQPTQVFIPLVTLAHAPRAREAAVIGSGSGITSNELLGSPYMQHVTTIEIEPKMIEASRQFYPANRRLFEDPRSRFVIDDARSYFASHGQKFDVIIAEPSNPWVSGVSGLFTREFYSRVRQYLTDDGVFGQWLQLYEIDDGLVLSVIAALAENFRSYSIFHLSEGDVVIVATNRGALPEPDWSVFQFPGIAADLRHVWPVTPQTMATLHIASDRALAPIVRIAGAMNSDFYPVLDLNAERTRYMKLGADGLEALASGRVNFAAIVDGRRNGPGDPYAVTAGVDRLDAMALAAAMRLHDERGGDKLKASISQREMFDAGMALGKPPNDWHPWVAAAAAMERTVHGGMAGVVDTAFYKSVYAYLDRTHAPPLARASVDFLHGMAAWDFAQASRAADAVVPAEAAGDVWLNGDQLRDGAVIAKLATGDRRGARSTFISLIARSDRSSTDFRTRLLWAYVIDTTATVFPRARGN